MKSRLSEKKRGNIFLDNFFGCVKERPHKVICAKECHSMRSTQDLLTNTYIRQK